MFEFALLQFIFSHRPNLPELVFQFLNLGLDHGGDLACGRDEEPVHVKDSHLVTLTSSKLKQTKFES